MKQVLNVILTHQAPSKVARMLDWWRKVAADGNILLAYGGPLETMAEIEFGPKLFVDDKRLRTSHHQRETQSYGGVFREVAGWLKGRDYSHVYVAEYDHLPLIEDLNVRQLDLLQKEGADVLGHELLRIDRTNHPLYLYNTSQPDFVPYWRSVSKRKDPTVALSMFGSGSFWTRECFEVVAAVEEPFPIYLELWLPTLAHHLGFRVRDFGDQNRFIRPVGDLESQITAAWQAGAWTLHPVKRLWNQERSETLDELTRMRAASRDCRPA